MIKNQKEMSAEINFPWCLTFFEKRGKELYGEKFQIRAEDHATIYKLLIYFLGNKLREMFNLVSFPNSGKDKRS